jgi:TM2 domain-containing membrane protein YozV
MAFGKRGAGQSRAAQPAFAVAGPVASDVDNEPGRKRGFFAGKHDDDFDINLGFMLPYGEGKSVIVLILMWFFLGGAGAHRFYLGHNMIGSAILLVNTIFAVSAAGAILSGVAGIFRNTAVVQPVWGWWLGVMLILSLWVLIDGIYVICRTLSAKV